MRPLSRKNRGWQGGAERKSGHQWPEKVGWRKKRRRKETGSARGEREEFDVNVR